MAAAAAAAGEGGAGKAEEASAAAAEAVPATVSDALGLPETEDGTVRNAVAACESARERQSENGGDEEGEGLICFFVFSLFSKVLMSFFFFFFFFFVISFCFFFFFFFFERERERRK